MNQLISHGNLKLGKDTLIFNITSAHDCESKKLGLCKIPDGKCYAERVEKFRKQTKPFRERQTMLWDILPARFIALNLHLMARRKQTPIKYIRFGESGDFRTQQDVEKMKDIAKHLPYTVYGYTARKDLEFNDLPENLIINGSGFMVDNQVILISDKKWQKHTCPGDCRFCSMCKAKNKLDIGLVLH